MLLFKWELGNDFDLDCIDCGVPTTFCVCNESES